MKEREADHGDGRCNGEGGQESEYDPDNAYKTMMILAETLVSKKLTDITEITDNHLEDTGHRYRPLYDPHPLLPLFCLLL